MGYELDFVCNCDPGDECDSTECSCRTLRCDAPNGRTSENETVGSTAE